MKNIWVNGCFDILHHGHMELLKYAKSLGDTLIVGIDVDDRVREAKGPTRPINTTVVRMRNLEEIEHVDKTTWFGTDEQICDLVQMFNIDTIVVGSEYKDKNVIGSKFAREVKYFDRIDNYSTTSILEGNGSS